jgi:sulfur carrier protein
MISLPMHIQINGESRAVADGMTVDLLLLTLSLKAPRVAVEVNGEVVVKSKQAQHQLRESDIVEIVTFVGGG